MQLEAIYDCGKLEFIKPVTFKRDRVRLTVEVPDNEIVDQPDQDILQEKLRRQARDMLDRLDAIRNAPLPQEDQSLTSKQLERIEAFDLRAQILEEKGRTV